MKMSLKINKPLTKHYFTFDFDIMRECYKCFRSKINGWVSRNSVVWVYFTRAYWTNFCRRHESLQLNVWSRSFQHFLQEQETVKHRSFCCFLTGWHKNKNQGFVFPSFFLTRKWLGSHSGEVTNEEETRTNEWNSYSCIRKKYETRQVAL